MIAVSDEWKELHKQRLLPEQHLEINVEVTDATAAADATVNVSSLALYSPVETILGLDKTKPTYPRYATLERNLWALDGSVAVFDDLDVTSCNEYVSYSSDLPVEITLLFFTVRTTLIPGITITWSTLLNDYATDFTVTAKNGDETVATVTVTDNTSVKSYVDLSLSNYDSITVTVNGWSKVDRRVRVERIDIGHILTFTKNDVLNYTHEQSGSLLSAELPKNSITFSIDNSTDRWNPLNPTGMEQYLAERQRVTVRYGLTVGDNIEWIKAGTFYLSEWDTPTNGIEATFTARDVFEFMIDKPYTAENLSSGTPNTIKSVVEAAIAEASLTDVITLDFATDITYTVSNGVPENGERTIAEIVQMCANAACDVVYQDRNGTLCIKPLDTTLSDYVVSSLVSYSHPQVALSTNIVQVVVNDTAGTGRLVEGEKQTVTNDIIYMPNHAVRVANWVLNGLQSRKIITGEFRADPRLDLFDVITVESKYGEITNVVIENITYTFSGAFKGVYTGRCI